MLAVVLAEPDDPRVIVVRWLQCPQQAQFLLSWNEAKVKRVCCFHPVLSWECRWDLFCGSGQNYRTRDLLSFNGYGWQTRSEDTMPSQDCCLLHSWVPPLLHDQPWCYFHGLRHWSSFASLFSNIVASPLFAGIVSIVGEYYIILFLFELFVMIVDMVRWISRLLSTVKASCRPLTQWTPGGRSQFACS